VTALTQPVGSRPPQTADEDAVRVELDLLANGGCDQVAFLQSMQQRFQSAPDGTWEVLSQLDQYYRRGKVKPEMYQAIKTALAESALGQGSNLTARVTAPAALAPELANDVLHQRNAKETIQYKKYFNKRF